MIEIDTNLVISQVTAKLIESSAKDLFGKVKKYFRNEKIHSGIDLGYLYEDYLKRTFEKNSKMKTLIYRRTPKDLYSFYECIDVTEKGEYITTRKNEKRISTSTVNNLLAISDKLVISGLGGCGKSTLSKYLFLDTIINTNYIPVLIELRAVNQLDNKEISAYSMVFNVLINNGMKFEEEDFEYSMEKGGYVIYLDGYDEINKDKLSKTSIEILNLCSKYPQNKYIITSRPSDSFLGWGGFTELRVAPLTKRQALSLIKKIEFDEIIKNNFYRDLNTNLYKKYRSFASNPLLLTIMLLTYENNARMPEKLNDFYELAFSTLFNMHDATKDSYVRDIRSGLSYEEFKLLFAYFCFKTFFKGQYEFTESSLMEYLQNVKTKFPEFDFDLQSFKHDITQSVCMLVKEGLVYRFVHRSFQEYFAAWYTCKIDDKIQGKLVTSWMKDRRYYDLGFLPMLFNLQKDKVNKLIFYPTLNSLYPKWNGKLTLEFIKLVFKGFKLNTYFVDTQFKANEVVGNRFLWQIIEQASDLNFIDPDPVYENEQAAEIIYAVVEQLTKEERQLITFEQLEEFIDEQIICDYFLYFEFQVQNGMKLVEQYKNNSAMHKRKYTSIIDEL